MKVILGLSVMRDFESREEVIEFLREVEDRIAHGDNHGPSWSLETRPDDEDA